MKKSLLLCPPTYYDIKYEINPWMSKDNPIDKARAMEQYETLTYAYEQLGVNYDELAPDESVPDQVFTTDTGHAENKKFIKANFKYGERKKEADIAEAYFKEKGYDIHTLPSDIYFEGGDLIKFDDIYLFGHGKRSSKEAQKPIEEVLGVELIDVELPDDTFYHLDTCIAIITKNVVVANLNALTKDGIETLNHHFSTVIPTTKKDNALMVCNLMNIGGNAVLTHGISNTLKDALRPHVELISTTPMSEYIKGGGSVHCVSLEIFE